MAFAERERRLGPQRRALDIGCGAARNAVPLARLGWQVTGTDLSWPMLCAAATRARDEGLGDRLNLVLAPMDALPFQDRSCDLIIACFLTEEQLVAELGGVGFAPDSSVPIREHNRRAPGVLASAAPVPVIYEAAFRREA